MDYQTSEGIRTDVCMSNTLPVDAVTGSVKQNTKRKKQIYIRKKKEI